MKVSSLLQLASPLVFIPRVLFPAQGRDISTSASAEQVTLLVTPAEERAATFTT